VDSSASPIKLLDLPTELHLHIIYHLDIKSRRHLKRANKHFHAFTKLPSPSVFFQPLVCEDTVLQRAIYHELTDAEAKHLQPCYHCQLCRPSHHFGQLEGEGLPWYRELSEVKRCLPCMAETGSLRRGWCYRSFSRSLSRTATRENRLVEPGWSEWWILYKGCGLLKEAPLVYFPPRHYFMDEVGLCEGCVS